MTSRDHYCGDPLIYDNERNSIVTTRQKQANVVEMMVILSVHEKVARAYINESKLESQAIMKDCSFYEVGSDAVKQIEPGLEKITDFL